MHSKLGPTGGNGRLRQDINQTRTSDRALHKNCKNNDYIDVGKTILG